MKALLKKHVRKFKFALVGGINTLIDFGILFILNSFGLNKFVANFCSTTVAFLFSFFANKNFTFKSKQNFQKQILPFLVVTLTGLWVIQPIIFWIIAGFSGNLNSELLLLIQKIVATLVTLVWNYILYARLVFKN